MGIVKSEISSLHSVVRTFIVLEYRKYMIDLDCSIFKFWLDMEFLDSITQGGEEI
jgi:hypothetical protein